MHGLCSVVLCFGARIKQMFSLCINTLSHTHTHNFTYITYTNTNIHIHSHTHACTHSDTHRPQWHTPFSSKIKLYRAQNQLTGTSKREKCQTHFLLFCQAFLTMKICDFFFLLSHCLFFKSYTLRSTDGTDIYSSKMATWHCTACNNVIFLTCLRCPRINVFINIYFAIYCFITKNMNCYRKKCLRKKYYHVISGDFCVISHYDFVLLVRCLATEVLEKTQT